MNLEINCKNPIDNPIIMEYTLIEIQDLWKTEVMTDVSSKRDKSLSRKKFNNAKMAFYANRY